MAKVDPVAQEIEQRKAGERAKALEKYGPEAVQPAGRPEFDIVDFAINEVIGLDRYGEMIRARFPDDIEMRYFGRQLQDFSRRMSPRLVGARFRLLRDGGVLGVVERDRMELPDNV